MWRRKTAAGDKPTIPICFGDADLSHSR